MTRMAHAEATAIIDAQPQAVYDLLADYRNGHQKILPKAHFTDLIVERGGRGAGTVVRLATKAFGREIPVRLVVSEPMPGRLLREEDAEAGVVTTFILNPTSGGNKTELTIATDWSKMSGIRGYFERLTTPPVARMIFRKELALIAKHMSARD